MSFKVGDEVFVLVDHDKNRYMGKIIEIKEHLMWPFEVLIERAFQRSDLIPDTILTIDSELIHWPLSKLEEIIYGI